MPITLHCPCGKTMKVDEKHRGKKAKCPSCAKVLTVLDTSEDEAKSGVQSEAPKKKRRAEPEDDSGSDSEIRKPIKRQGTGKRNLIPWIAAGGCGCFALLGCLIAVGIGVWYFLFRAGDPDLIYVHEGVAGFVSIRVADTWKSPAVKDLLKEMPADAKKEMDKDIAEAEGKIGLKVEDLERVTTIVRSTDFAKPDFCVVMKTSKAMDSKKVIDFIAKKKNEKEKEVKNDGITYYTVGKTGDMMVFHFPTDRIVLVTDNETTLKDVVKKAAKPATGAAVKRGVQMASSGGHTYVAAFELKKDLMDKIPPDMMKQAPNLREINGMIFAGTLAKDLALEAIATFPSKDMADKAKKDVDGLVAVGKMAMKAGKNPPAGVVKFMDSVLVEARGPEVVIKAKVDLDPKGFGGIPGLPFGGGGGGAGGGGPKFGGAARIQGINNLKQIGLAIHSFHDAHKSLPNHAILHPKTGQALLSWRVSLLPYLDQGPLYNQIRRDEPWDSKHNQQFWNQMPNIYRLPGRPNVDQTYYQVFHGQETAFPKSRLKTPNTERSGVSMVGITDGTSNTIFVAEAAAPVNWMKPEDIPFQMGQATLVNQVGNHWGDDTFMACFGDGTAARIRRAIPPLTLQALVTANGGEPVDRFAWDAP